MMMMKMVQYLELYQLHGHSRKLLLLLFLLLLLLYCSGVLIVLHVLFVCNGEARWEQVVFWGCLSLGCIDVWLGSWDQSGIIKFETTSRYWNLWQIMERMRHGFRLIWLRESVSTLYFIWLSEIDMVKLTFSSISVSCSTRQHHTAPK